MARKRREDEKPVTPYKVLGQMQPALTVGVREVRNRFKEAVESGVPMVITNHGSFSAVLIPIKSGYWHRLNEERAARKALQEALDKILEHLRI